MSGPLDHGGTVVVRPSNDKRPKSRNEGASSSNSSVCKLPSPQTLNLIYRYPIYQAALAQSSQSLDALLDSTFGSPPLIPPLHFQLSSHAQSGPPRDLPIEIPASSRNNNPFLNRFMVVPPAEILPIEEGQISTSSRKKDKLPATVGTTVMPTNDAAFHSTPKMSGEWSLIPPSVIP